METFEIIGLALALIVLGIVVNIKDIVRTDYSTVVAFVFIAILALFLALHHSPTTRR